MKTKIGGDDAKAKLATLPRQVKAGKQFTITYRGKAIADLVPSESVAPKDKAAAVDKFKAFMRENPVRGSVDVKQLIEDGRA